jgi:proline iminopeptidase
MNNTYKNFKQINIKYKDFNLVCYDSEIGDITLFLLNGGPGLPCNYLRDPHYENLINKGIRIITYDQLGCGQSSKPKDLSLWSIDRYVEELEFVRNELNLGKLNLLGHSWGGWLAIEYSLKYQKNLNKLILENTCGDMPHLISELNRLREALGSETVKMMLRHEAEGTLDHPEYQAAITILNYRHVCRLDEWPDSIHASLNDWNMDVYGTMQGPNEFLYIGNLKEWNRINEMKEVKTSSLITVGMHDELPPSCALKMHNALPNSVIKVFKNSSHMPFYEEPKAYFKTLINFLK